jgi:hypothetical protein
MSANQSFLSSEKYGYDFVVATTQESINAGLKEYLDTIDQPVTNLCFLVDDNGNPSNQISLDDLKAKTGGIDPFEIPDGTDPDDERIRKLTEQRFAVGIKLKLGLPSNVLPKNMPFIVELGSSANNVTFNLFSSEFKIVENTPAGGWTSKGSWKLISQPSDKLWYFSTKVNLLYADLDTKLNTPYFNKHPKKKQILLNQLKNLSSTAFSLQQLLFDLDNAALQSIPTITNIPTGSNADIVLTKYFLRYYFKSIKEHGEPVLAVKAVARNIRDHSSLQLTGMERQVNPFIDGKGIVERNPTREQKQATTLAYLCAANDNSLPGAATFNWNWVEPSDIANQSGVIAINRKTLANFYQETIVPLVKQSCIKVKTKVDAYNVFGGVTYKWWLTPGQDPKVEFPMDDSKVLTISYCSSDSDSDNNAATHGELKLESSFLCHVFFKDDTIQIVQHLKIYCYVKWAATGDGANIVDKTITDTYTISVGQDGMIEEKRTESSSLDDSKSSDLNSFVNFWTGINDLVDDIKKKTQALVATDLKVIPANSIQNFVFPGANVFTYRDARFSEKQDLVAAIMYVRPS